MTISARILPGLATLATRCEHGLRLSFVGPDSTEKMGAAEFLSARLQRPLLQVRLSQLHTTSTDFVAALRIAFRMARFEEVILYLDEHDAICNRDPSLANVQLMAQMAEATGIVILDSASTLTAEHQAPEDLITLAFISHPDFLRRREMWKSNLKRHGLESDEALIVCLAERFHLTSRQIANEPTPLGTRPGSIRWSIPLKAAPPQTRSCLPAARSQTRHVLAHLATHIPPSYDWKDLVLPDDTMIQLREACGQLTHRRQVLDLWGFDAKLSHGKGRTSCSPVRRAPARPWPPK